jgi:NAD+ kinase
MSSTPGSAPRLPEPAPVTRAAVITHGKPQTIGPALERLEAAAHAAGVQLLLSAEEREKHGIASSDGDVSTADIAVVLGGDGTMLRALQQFRNTGVPVIGVNFGRVGFLASIDADALEQGVARVFAGDYRVGALPTLDAEVEGERRVAVNDVVAASATLGRMVELAWAVGGEELGIQPCDGIISATPTGSTAYNLSNGGPVLVRGLDAMAITFIAPHSLHARPMVAPRGLDLEVRNRSADVPVRVLVDGHAFVDVGPNGTIHIGLGDERCLLATLPEMTFFRRYRQIFGP